MISVINMTYFSPDGTIIIFSVLVVNTRGAIRPVLEEDIQKFDHVTLLRSLLLFY
jgi:hypothetical protein